MYDNDRQRITAVEVKIGKLEMDFSEHEALNRESFALFTKRLDRFINNEVHGLQAQINTVRKQNGVALTRTEWLKILASCIAVTGAIIVALIECGVIGS